MAKNKENNFLSAVVYVKNNSKSIEKFLLSLNTKLDSMFKNYEIICVNDASSDDSVAKIKSVAKKLNGSMLSIINMSFYQGLEQSMAAGIDLAIGDFVIEFDFVDSDLDMELAEKVYFQALKGYDIVAVSSENNSSFISSIYYKIFNKYSNNQYKIQTEFFRILSRRAINRVKSLGINVPYRKALYSNCGLKMNRITIPLKKQSIDRTVAENSDTAITSVILFTNFAYKLSLIVSLLFMMMTIFSALYVLIVFIAGNPAPGYTSIILLLSASFFGLFSLLTVIVKYLSVITSLVYKKQSYLIESIEKINNK